MKSLKKTIEIITDACITYHNLSYDNWHGYAQHINQILSWQEYASFKEYAYYHNRKMIPVMVDEICRIYTLISRATVQAYLYELVI